jgi:hypothetical protein
MGLLESEQSESVVTDDCRPTVVICEPGRVVSVAVVSVGQHAVGGCPTSDIRWPTL